MSGFTYRLGPFLGGLNNAADTPDTIQDNELSVCLDFDYNIDGTLITRPLVAREPIGTPFGNYYNILGIYVDPSSGHTYTVAESNGDLIYRQGSIYFVDATSSWASISTGFGHATCGIQYVDTFYIVSEAGTGGKWSPGAGFASVTDLPNGSSISLFKERLWVSSGTSSRLYFSNVGTGDTWSPSDFADINAGDGQKLIAIYSGPASLYLFKESSTFVLTYDSAPTRGFVQNISTTVGVYDPNCITEYQDSIFILYGAQVYNLNGYTFTRINNKVDLTRDTAAGSYPVSYSMSTVGDRIIVSYLDKCYAYHPLTGTWTQWNIPPVTKWFQVPLSLEKYGYNIYLASPNEMSWSTGSVYTLQDTTYSKMVGTLIDVGLGDPVIKTREYSMDFYRRAIFDTPEHWKRLYWWGIDAIVSSAANDATVQMSIIPYRFSTIFTWEAMSNETWGDLLNKNWGDLQSDPFSINTLVQVTEPNRKYIKANKSVRFTRIQFRITFPGYKHDAISSINHITINFAGKENPVSAGEGTQI